MFRTLLLLGTLLSLTVQAELTDPTRPPQVEQARQTQQTAVPLKLQQIIRRSGQRYALIDGRKVTVGEQLGDYRVRAIGATQVELEKSDQTLMTLNLFKKIKNEDAAK